ncbi:Transcriptional Regulator XRE family protein [Geitlerinema sp. FC II]|uniref:helix-turn-helix domain-containing protein n=1 Tax=Baaleninema simplex TaxID=2862350 RepID=UPI000344EC19|nr:helix-turn-helix transcriptional regulator [Baaleninema simplex]MDC0831938.1 helix-turn-helix transcriptional regulator [Geitlerinema sp. CS-897]PPT07352.1 Transcriptional Regulator XRE family protein [Geitlerinema sp. FC II]
MDESRHQILQAFGSLVKQKRILRQLSQEELGFRANLDRTYISGVERGVRNPSLVALVQIASGLEITVSELLDSLEAESQNIQ